MQLCGDILLAWAALILAFLVVIIWVMRLVIKNRKPYFLFKINRWLRRHHKIIGMLLIAAGLAHGLLSDQTVFSLNLGTVSWIICVLLGISWLLRKKFSIKKAWMYCHRLLTVAFVALIVIHIVDVGGFLIGDIISGKIGQPQIAVINSVQQTAEPSETAVTATATDTVYTTPSAEQTPSATAGNASPYKDGVYQGTAAGYRPGIVVEVTIEGGKIASVTVVTHHEKGKNHWGTPVAQIPQAIVDAQSTNVDSISGATRTSEGIKNAVNDALLKAMQ